MKRTLYGALTVGTRKTVDACSTVEARTIAGERIVLLTAVQGELATPTLEVVKGAFAKITAADETAARKLAAPGLPPQFASGVAVILLVGDRALHGASGGARCYRERGGVLTPLAAGAIDLLPGDTVVAASHAELPTETAFLGAVVDPGGDDTFRNDGLDAALDAALARHASLLSAAAAHLLA